MAVELEFLILSLSKDEEFAHRQGKRHRPWSASRRRPSASTATWTAA